jgi:DNA-binding Lrp family transcriptional regulator
LKDEQRKILKIMNEATNRMDLNMFAEAVKLTPGEAIANVQALTNEGFLRKLGSGYGLTEKGKNTLKAFVAVPQEKAFQFYTDIDKPGGFSAISLEEFYYQIKQVDSDSLDFHLYRDDFENWLRQVVSSDELADEAANFKKTGLYGEELRRAFLKSIDANYGIEYIS